MTMRIPTGLLALACFASPATAETVTSPDGRISVELDADGEGIPFYSVTRDGKPIIAKSNLGFNFTDADPMRRNFAVVETETGSADETWEQPWGESRFVRDRHNAGRVRGITVMNEGRVVNIEARKGVVICTGGHIGNVNFRRTFDPRLTEEYQQAGEPYAHQNADGELAAYAIVMWIPDEVHLLNLSVPTELQGRGIGRAALEWLCANASARNAGGMLLEVRPSNLPAVHLYESSGFTRIGVRRRYYPAAEGTREDAWVLFRKFGDQAGAGHE